MKSLVPPRVEAVAPKAMVLAKVIPEVLACKVLFPVKVTAPVPSAVLLPALNVPAPREVPPS